jgi:hypothetical protein
MAVQQADEFEQRLENASHYPPAWRFDQDGAVIVGELVGFGEFDAGYGPYPIVTLRLADGTQRAVHCQREVLSRELAKARPRIGERLGIKWLGIPEGKSYHRYVVRVDRPQGSSLDWGRYVDGASAEEVEPPAAAVGAMAGDPGPDQRSPVADEEIPF